MRATMQSAIVSSGLFDIQFHIIDLHRFVLFGGFLFTFIIQSSNRPRNQPAEPRNPTLLKTALGLGLMRSGGRCFHLIRTAAFCFRCAPLLTYLEQSQTPLAFLPRHCLFLGGASQNVERCTLWGG